MTENQPSFGIRRLMIFKLCKRLEYDDLHIGHCSDLKGRCYQVTLGDCSICHFWGRACCGGPTGPTLLVSSSLQIKELFSTPNIAAKYDIKYISTVTQQLRKLSCVGSAKWLKSRWCSLLVTVKCQPGNAEQLTPQSYVYSD